MDINQDNPSESITYDHQTTVKQNEDENFPLIASITTGCKVRNSRAEWSTLIVYWSRFGGILLAPRWFFMA